MWDLESGLGMPPVLEIERTALWMTAARVVWTADRGLLVISADDEGRLRVRGGPADRDVVAPVQAHEGQVNQICAVRADEDGLSFVTGGADWFLRKWRLADGALTLTAQVDVSEEATATP